MKKTRTQERTPCLNCGANMTTQRQVAQVIGLPSVTVQDAIVTTCLSCGEREVGFERIDDLHRAIAAELILKRGPLAGDEMRFLRGVTGLSSDEVARALDIAPATWSRIENERQTASVSLERLFRFAVHTHLELTPPYPLAILGPLSGGGRAPLRMSFAFDGERWTTTVASAEVRIGRARRLAGAAR